MREDPPVRRDGACVRCRQPKPTVSAKSQIRDLAKHLAKDPFCTARCCRLYFGVKLSMEESPQHARVRTEAQTSPRIISRKVA